MNYLKKIPFVLLICLLFSCGKEKPKDTIPPVKALLSVADVKMERPDKDKIIFQFVVNVENASASAITVKYETVEGSAKAGTDYTAVNGLLTIEANKSNALINVEVKGDSTRSAEKIFYLQLSTPSNAKLLGDGKATGTIICDGTYLPVADEGYRTPTAYPGFTLKWNEEFNAGKIEATSWNSETGGSGWGNNELQNYTNTPKNAFVSSNGYLVIEARKEMLGSNQYTSARLTTQGKKEFTYGRMDIRAKLPKGQGIWPAIWMLGSNIASTPWPASGEIDILEMLGHEPNKSYGTIHWGNVGSASSSKGSSYVLPSGDYYEKFHVFSLIWTADKLEWYIDDVKFFTFNKSELMGNYPFDKPFFFILNVAVGGNWPGNPDVNTILPQRMMVDYVRVFQ